MKRLEREKIISLLEVLEKNKVETIPVTLLVRSQLDYRTLKGLLELERNKDIPEEIKKKAYTPKFYTRDNMITFYNTYKIHSIIPEAFFRNEEFLYKTKITRLPDNFLRGNKWIDTVTIPKAITTIGKSAFENTSVNIVYCEDREDLVIEERAFAGCGNLLAIDIPEGTTEIKKEAFAGCAMLKVMPLPLSLRRLEEYAFADCTDLHSISIPASVGKINMNVLKGCKKLESIDFYDENEEYMTIDDE